MGKNRRSRLTLAIVAVMMLLGAREAANEIRTLRLSRCEQCAGKAMFGYDLHRGSDYSD